MKVLELFDEKVVINNEVYFLNKVFCDGKLSGGFYTNYNSSKGFKKIGDPVFDENYESMHYSKLKRTNKYNYSKRSKSLRVAFDTEYKSYDEEGYREVLSYQFSWNNRLGVNFLILLPKERLSLAEVISIIHYLDKDVKVLRNQKRNKEKGKFYIELTGHYNIADFSTLDDFDYFKKELIPLNSSVYSSGFKYSFINNQYKNAEENKIYSDVVVAISDTINLLPAKLRRLNDAAEALGLDNLEIDFNKEDMKSVMENDFDRFLLYSLNDVDIVRRFSLMFREVFWNDWEPLPTSLGKIVETETRELIKEFNKYTTNKEYNEKFRGLESVGSKKRVRDLQFNDLSDDLQSNSIKAYMGGLNNSYKIGYYEGRMFDYDLKSAYPLSMMSSNDIDYRQIKMVLKDEITYQDIKDGLKITDYGVGLVSFEFPTNVRPTIPQKSNQGRGVIYSRKGEGLVSVPELYVAILAGARIRALRPFTIYGSKDVSTFRFVMGQYTQKRNFIVEKYGKGSVQEGIQKTINNMNYGKLSQGISENKVFSKSLVNESIGISEITNPVYANQTTSLVRAIMSYYLIELERLGYNVFSITTDGLITDAPFKVIDNIKIDGFSDELEKRVVEMGSKDKSIWSVKGSMSKILNIKTRGNIGFGSDVDYEEGVFAKANFRLPGNLRTKKSQKDYLIDIYLNGKDKEYTTYSVYELPAISEYFKNKNVETIGTERKVSIDFSYDYKQKPTDIEMVDIINPITNKVEQVMNFNTSAWESIEEFELFRDAKENADKRIFNIDDYKEILIRADALKNDIRVYNNNVKRSVAISIIRLYYSGVFGESDIFKGTDKEIIKNIEKAAPQLKGHIKEYDLWNARREGQAQKTLSIDVMKDLINTLGLKTII